MARRKTDPEKLGMAFRLSTLEGMSIRDTSKAIAKAFGCSPPSSQTIWAWVKKGERYYGYLGLLDEEETRVRVATRYRELYGMARSAYSNGGMTPDERAAMDAMLKIQTAEVRLHGIASMSAVGELPVDMEPEIAEAVRTALAQYIDREVSV